jgi:SpoVK/Ycf46/Vps4 family AAA+-type ATPase
MSLKEIKNRNIYLTVQDWPQAPVTTSDEAPQVDEEQKADRTDGFFGFSLDALEHEPVLNRQVNVFRKVYFRSERIADKTSMEYVHAKQLSALLATQILQELKLEKQRVTPN